MLPFQLYIPDLYKSSFNNNNLTTEIQKRSRVEHLLSSPFDVGFALFHKQRLLVKFALLVDQANVVDIQIFLQEEQAVFRQQRNDVFLTRIQSRQDEIKSEVAVFAVEKSNSTTPDEKGVQN